MGITGSGFNFKDTVIDGQEGNIEGTTAQIEDQNVSFTLTFFVKTVSNSGSCWLIDDSQYIESGDNTGILGGLSL